MNLTCCVVLDQFLHSNINTRTDAYGGSTEARCKFPLDLITAVAGAIGASNVGIRLEPAGLYNGTYGDERIETWSHLCKRLASYPEDNKLSYVHFIEPRMDRVEACGDVFYDSWSLPKISNDRFRRIMQEAGVPCFACGGFGPDKASAALDPKGWDGVAFAKWFVSNPDLPERLRLEKRLQTYDRSRFYGSWDGIRTNGYTDYPSWEQEEENKHAADTMVPAETALGGV